MKRLNAPRANLLGDIRAEADDKMLGVAFFETPDYRTIVESSDRVIVVGRRGTGKSATFRQLQKRWSGASGTRVIELSPDEDELIGLRPLLRLFGGTFPLIRAGARLAWRYALLLEMLSVLSQRYLPKQIQSNEFLLGHFNGWRRAGNTITSRLEAVLHSKIAKDASPEERIGKLAQLLQLRDLESGIKVLLEDHSLGICLLLDRLDEGYQPDDLGVGLVAGLVQATIDVLDRFPTVRPVLFLRDNIFRAIQRLDPDSSRNLEGRVLRLHWDEYQLFNLVCNRLRAARGIEIENNRRLWDRVTAAELRGQEGFRRCLQYTLYRPRDILALLNEAFLHAQRECREEIIGADLSSTAKEISVSRLDDLHKEYGAILLGLPFLTAAFQGTSGEVTVSDACASIGPVVEKDDYPPETQQWFAVLGGPMEAIRALYSVGFLGVQDDQTGSFVFCHDGRAPNREFRLGDRLLIHPCYWIALNITRIALEPEQAAHIHDEYEIAVLSDTPEQRRARLVSLAENLETVPIGTEGASAFESWCFDAIRICFAGGLRNVELKPNRSAVQRRDVVGTNLGETAAWQRIFEDYRVRQVVFEIKNKETLDEADFRQLHSYLGKDYGKLGFLVSRSQDLELRAGPELNWTREMFGHHEVLIVRLTARFLRRLLGKLANPDKHDYADNALSKLLDTYTRLYLPVKS